MTRQTGNSVTKDIEIMVSIKYLSNLQRTLEIPLINCEISPQLTCCKKHILAAGGAADQIAKFKMADTNLYVLIVTLTGINFN